MKSIWKFVLGDIDAQGIQTVAVPGDAKLLYAREQGDDICVWAEVDPLSWKGQRTFEIFATGQKWPDDVGVERVYLGSAHLHGGDFVFHVYERKS